VTSFTFRLFPVGPEIIGGAIAWPAEEAEAVFELHRELMASAPPEFACVAALRKAPPAPWLSPDIHGKPIVLLVACDTGDIKEAERRASEIKKFGRPVGDIIQRRPYASQQSLLDATQPKGRRYYWKSEYLPALTPDIYRSALEHSRRITSPHSAVILFPLGGAVGQHPEDFSAAGNRDAQWVLNIAAAWEKPEEDAANIAWARSTWEDMRKFSTGGSYINFQTEDEGVDRIRAAYRKNYDRLVEVKSKWDPQNLFRANKNISPGKQAA
jgi:FAD/FMN-containing dehydrogenase